MSAKTDITWASTTYVHPFEQDWLDSVRAIDELGKLGSSKFETRRVTYVYGDLGEMRTINPGYKVPQVLQKSSIFEGFESGKDSPRLGGRQIRPGMGGGDRKLI